MQGSDRSIASLCVWELLQPHRVRVSWSCSPAGVDVRHLPRSFWWVSLPCPHGLLLSQVHQLTVVCGDSSLRSASCTASKVPRSAEIQAALPKVKRDAAHRDATGPGPPSTDELSLPHSLWLSTDHIALKVTFLILSCKE